MSSEVIANTRLNILTARALRVFLNHTLISTAQYSANLRSQLQSEYHTYEVSKNWENIIELSKRIIKYIKNCQSDDDRNIFSALGLVVIDRTEEALKFSVQAIKNRCRPNYGLYLNHADVQLFVSKCIISALIAEQDGFMELSNMWILVSHSRSLSPRKMQSTFNQLESYRKKAHSTHNKQLKVFYQQIAVHAAYNTALDIIIKASEKLNPNGNRSYKQLNHAAGCALSSFSQAAAHTVRSEVETEYANWWLQLAQYEVQSAEFYAQVSADTTEERYNQLLHQATEAKKNSRPLLHRSGSVVNPTSLIVITANL